LAKEIRTEPFRGKIKYVAGADMAFSKDGRYCLAGVVVWDVDQQEVVEESLAWRAVRFPYVPGLLSFRETPAVLAAIRKLRCTPDVFMFDAHGFAHPRRFGLASHAGLLMDYPSVGCAKSRLCGQHREPSRERGRSAPLKDGTETIGAVVRTRQGVKPVYVSIGHRMTLKDAKRIVLKCTGRYRLPEPTRQAHILVSRQTRDV
jgi:deoxyribonuclease V